jgi:hypothetical protein
MPFSSSKQLRFMYATHPKIAKRWTKEQERKHEPLIRPKKPKKRKTNG